MVNVTNSYGRNIGFLDWSCYFSFQIAPQLYSRGWVDPVPDPLLLRKSGSTGNWTNEYQRWNGRKCAWNLKLKQGLSCMAQHFEAGADGLCTSGLNLYTWSNVTSPRRHCGVTRENTAIVPAMCRHWTPGYLANVKAKAIHCRDWCHGDWNMHQMSFFSVYRCKRWNCPCA
jgi:hypothetical protein